ncbi:MAG: hypothetical protein EBS41_03160, partial [Actinobacteria bacterium]|nr:hypothetical protein [Actinomycetota bacterium]
MSALLRSWMRALDAASAVCVYESVRASGKQSVSGEMSLQEQGLTVRDPDAASPVGVPLLTVG